jgi:cytoskeletal protein RodZ
MEGIHLKTKVNLKRKDDSTQQPPEEKKSNKLIWFVLIGLVGIVAFLSIKNDSADNSIENVVKTEETTTEETTAEETTTEETTAEETTAEETTTEETTAEETTAEETTADETATVTGTIEEKAKQVISGAFGNGAERKRNLGADYAEIQAKVNEMYRNR